VSQKALEDAIYTALTTSQGAGTVYAAVSGRIYIGEAPDSVSEPLITIAVVVDVPDRRFPSKADVDSEVQVDLFGDEEQEDLQDINTKLFTALDNVALTMSGYVGATCQCIDRGTTFWFERRPQIITRWRVIASAT
jgi:hypothetical protein